MSDDSSKKTASAAKGAKDEVAAESTEPPRLSKITWGPLAAVLVVVFGYLAAQVLGSLFILLYTNSRHWNSQQANDWLQNSVTAQFVYVVLSEGITMAVLWIFLQRRKASWRSLGLTRPRPSDAPRAVLGTMVYFILFLSVIGVLKAVIHLDVNQQQDIGFSHVYGPGALAMTFVSLVVLPPLVEETLFRGFLYSGLRKSWGTVGAFIGTSLLFAVPHLLESGDQRLLWVGGVDTFVLSLVLCYLRERTGRLWAGIGVHALKNGLAFLSLFILHTR